jgi:hypothetical protein
MGCAEVNCIWNSGERINSLKYELDNLPNQSSVITVGVYNIHTLWEKQREHRPNYCELPTNLTIAESPEAHIRYNYLFEPSFPYFDGNLTTHPVSSVQVIYAEAFLNKSNFIQSLNNFSTLIKAASYVATDCHRTDFANANRDDVVKKIRNYGFRVDGLARCMRSIGPEGVYLRNYHNTDYNLLMKRETIGKFMFNLAFENSIEEGYVTEKA